MELDSQKITDIIETVRIGVEDSWVGKIAEYGGTAEKPTKQVNQVAYAMYLTLLGKVFDKLEQIDVIPPAPTSEFLLDDDSDLM